MENEQLCCVPICVLYCYTCDEKVMPTNLLNFKVITIFVLYALSTITSCTRIRLSKLAQIRLNNFELIHHHQFSPLNARANEAAINKANFPSGRNICHRHLIAQKRPSWLNAKMEISLIRIAFRSTCDVKWLLSFTEATILALRCQPQTEQ